MSDSTENAVAIVGMGAVFPGAGDAATFWRNIKAGTDSISEVSPDRWDPEVYCDPVQGGAAPFYTRRGGFLGELATFNPGPFGIMPSSVDGTEPDQLLMLRAAAAAIADGGTRPDPERTGVIIGRGGYLTPGISRLDQRVSAVHQLTAVLSDLLPDLGSEQLAAVRTAFEERLGPDDPLDAVGLVPNFAASRLANRFDLRGPAYTVDAACASSLIAVDHAVRELTSGRCDAVLAGGVHTCHHPTLWSVFTRLRVLSPRGVIRPFDAQADGTLLSEGAGAVLLKRLADARADGDRVYAVIRGVGVSSDGRAHSMLNPLVEGQELAIRRAWAAAGLDPAAPDALGLVEAHGTATPTGDRAEVTALGRVFGSAAGGPAIGIGSVKSMIGHAMPAAGIAGLIKTAFAVHEGVLPPTLHVDEPNPAFAGTRFAPVTQTRPWDDGPVRRAAVSAFGFGGINAHVVLESEPAPAASGTGPRGGGTGVRYASSAGRAAGPAQPGGEVILRLGASDAAEMSALLRASDAELIALAARPGDGASAGRTSAAPCRLAVVTPDERRLGLARKIVERGTPWRGRSD
ncbi:MAG TPA: polyketide synthase, partial [Trebonia sp.]